MTAVMTGMAAMMAPPAAAAQEVLCHHAAGAGDPANLAGQGVRRTLAAYEVPAVQMRSATGETVSLREALARGPVMVNFIYTSCTTVCPAMSATFSEVRERLGPEGAAVRMVSVSIDPENDTPARLREYAARFRAGEEWQFLTGSVADSVAVQRAFGAFRGNKMNHAPLTLLRARPTAPWVRMDGYASAATLAAAMQGLLSQDAAGE